MASRINWLKLRIEELLHVRKGSEEDTGEEEESKLHFEIKPSLELAMVVIEAILVVYLILGLMGIVPIF